MGVRINYHISKEGKGLWELIEENYTQFREWCIDMQEESEKEYNEDMFNPDLILFLLDNENLPSIDSLEQDILDEIVKEFIGSYCDIGKGKKLLELLSPWMNVRNYISTIPAIQKTKNEVLIKFWDYLISGRSLKNNNRFLSNDHFLVGFFTIQEQQQFLKLILEYFGSSPNDKGLTYILQVLNEIKNLRTELIITVG
jgi:hypothetical protein